MRLDLVEKQHSICRIVWPIAGFMVITYFLLVYFFTNEELKNMGGIEFYIALGIPMMFAVGYCKFRIYFESPLKTDLNSGAIEINEKGLIIKGKEYDIINVENVTIQSVKPISSREELTMNEILIKTDGGESRYHFQLSTIEECERLVVILNKTLVNPSKLEISEEIKTNANIE